MLCIVKFKFTLRAERGGLKNQVTSAIASVAGLGQCPERTHGPGLRRRGAVFLALIVLASVSGCATPPPGFDYPKVPSHTLENPQATRLGQQFARASAQNSGRSAFRILNVGVDGFLMRLEMIDAAERTLDLQYYIFRGDESGRLLTDALSRAADRGVRVRVLVDEAESVAGDEQLLALSGHAAIEIRVFNPWRYRGHSRFRRDVEYILHHSRLDYRMHNKMLIVDGAVALAGGRNIGDQYFQIDPQSQFADDDVFAGGPIVGALSSKFDEFWNTRLAIPAEALAHRDPNDLAASSARLMVTARARKVAAAGFNYREKLATGEPLSGILSGESSLVWADAEFVCDAADKKSVVAGTRVGDLMYESLSKRVRQSQTELIVVTPYFVPSPDEFQLLQSLAERKVRVRVLTNSLETNPNVAAHAGYTHYRVPLLQSGGQLSEVRALLGNTRGSGESKRLAQYGNYALHAKVYVVDRKAVYVGSMNFDVRSRRLNTEMGFIIDSADLSQQEATRFDAMTRPENAYSVTLRPGGTGRVLWHTVEDGEPVDHDREPARSNWQRVQAKFLAWLPLDREL
jgi:cardiolipin synthase C